MNLKRINKTIIINMKPQLAVILLLTSKPRLNFAITGNNHEKGKYIFKIKLAKLKIFG